MPLPNPWSAQRRSPHGLAPGMIVTETRSSVPPNRPRYRSPFPTLKARWVGCHPMLGMPPA